LRKDALMLPLNAALSRCTRIGCNPTIAPNIHALRPRGPALGMIVRFMQSLLQALHESRLEQAKREIHRVRHLMPTQAVKIGEPHPDVSASDESHRSTGHARSAKVDSGMRSGRSAPQQL
jgi:hypothetical protein